MQICNNVKSEDIIISPKLLFDSIEAVFFFFLIKVVHLLLL